MDEAKIISMQYQSGLFCRNGDCSATNGLTGKPFTADDIRTFLIDHNLGIECSGFVSQVLRAHYRETKKIDFTSKIFIAPWANFFRRLLVAFRPIENVNVAVLANPINSTTVIGGTAGYNYANVSPGDILVMLETGPVKKRNHILLITNFASNVIDYVHARAWTSEGRYGHGVSRGTITITNPGEPLTAQRWEEKNETGDKNETLTEAKQAKVLEIKRLKV
jgi:hypothetical protein